MDSLYSLFGNEEVDLKGMFKPEPSATTKIPAASLRNRSATYSLLTQEGTEVVPTFRALMSEGSRNENMLLSSLEQTVKAREDMSERQVLTNILSDSSISLSQKQAILNEYNNKGSFRKDSHVVAMTNSLTNDSDTNKNEPEVVRRTMASYLREKYEANQMDQRNANLFASKLAGNEDSAFFEAMELTFVPFAQNKAIGQIITDVKKKTNGKPTFFDFIKAYTLAGNSIADLREQIANLPASEAARMKDAVRQSIQANSDMIFSKDADFAKYQMEQSILGDEYGGVIQMVDNLLPLLDLVGLGGAIQGAVKTGSKLAKPTARAKEIAQAEQRAARQASEAPQSIFEERKLPTPNQDVARAQKTIDALEEEKALILGDSSGLLDPGVVRELRVQLDALKEPVSNKGRVKELQKSGMSFKEATAAAKKEFSDEMGDFEATRSRLQGQLDANASAAKNEQRLAELEAKITALKKNQPEASGSVLTQLSEAMSKIEWNGVGTGIYNPSAIGHLMGTTNSGTARQLFRAISESPDDDLPKALFGTNKLDAQTSQAMPQAIKASGPVGTRVMDIQKSMRAGVNVDQAILDTVETAEWIGLTPKEKADIRANVTTMIKDADGLVAHDSMGGFSVNPANNRYNISGVFGTQEGGFSTAKAAKDQANIALRRFGIKDEDITILRREGNNHIEIPKGELPTEEGEYFVRINSDQAYDVTNAADLEGMNVKRNFFDRFTSVGAGSFFNVSRFIADPASMLDPLLTRPASAATDRASNLEKILLNLADDYAKAWKKLDKQSRQKVELAITEANEKGIDMNRAYLLANHTVEEADALTKWRTYWDNHYYLENLDIVRTLNNNRFMLLDNGNVRLFAKEIQKNQNINRVYDPTLDSLVTLSKQEMDNLYNTGGTLAELRRPEVINGDVVSHTMVRNNGTEYLRKVTDNDQVLNYRPGYYQISYKAPKFIDKEFTDASGNVYKKAIAVAPDTLTAQNFIDRMKMVDPNGVYHPPRSDRSLLMSDNDRWDLSSARGRIAQRHRGKLLEEADGINNLGDHSFVADPVESAIRAARSIAGRTMTRPMLENAKARFMQVYGDLIPSENGLKRFPGRIQDIYKLGKPTDSFVADARTTWEYINYLENGYINSADLLVKGIFNVAGDYLAKAASSTKNVPGVPKAVSKLERVAESVASGAGPTSLAKNAVFMAYMVSHPLRQIVVQPQQIMRLWAYSPTGALKAIQQSTEVLGIKAGLKPMTKEMRELIDFVEESGQLASVDRSNLVRGTLTDAAHLSGPVGRAVRKGLNVPRTIGFDVGEQTNLAAHLIAVYNKYKAAGKDMSDPDVRLAAQTDARALSYEMNFAGDFSYNQGSMSAALQFAQVPHKAWLQLTNRKIDPAIRARMFVSDMLIWGPPTAAVTYLYNQNIMPEEDTFLSETVLDGIQSAAFNTLARQTMGPDQQKIDFSSLDPYDISGWTRFYEALMNDGLQSIIANSPSGQIFLKDGGKIQNIIGQLGRVFSPIDAEAKTIDEVLRLAEESARFFGGIDAAYKAKIMLETGKRIDQMGNVQQEHITKLDAIAQLFGFTNYNYNHLMKLSMEVSKNEKQKEKDATVLYNQIKHYYSTRFREGVGDFNWMTGVSGWILNGAYKDDPTTQMYLLRKMKSDMLGKDQAFFRQTLRAAGHPDLADIKAQVFRSGLPEEKKKQILQMFEDIQNYRDVNKVSNE